jgi:hypothetical protein
VTLPFEGCAVCQTLHGVLLGLYLRHTTKQRQANVLLYRTAVAVLSSNEEGWTQVTGKVEILIDK